MVVSRHHKLVHLASNLTNNSYLTTNRELTTESALNNDNTTARSIIQQNFNTNIFFVSTRSCTLTSTRFFCGFASLLILVGFLCHAFIFPLLIVRMKKLKSRFRNQYNISFLWLCSILLMTSIDILELSLNADPRVFSIMIVILMAVYFVSCLVALIFYMRSYVIDKSHYQNALSVILCTCIFLMIVFARLWSQKTLDTLSKRSKEKVIGSSFSYYILNTYFFLYYFVYILFGTVQIYQNFKNRFARCLSNSCYGAWILGSFFLSYYSAILPKQASFDYIHYKNYFLMTTLILIILQEINYIRVRLNEKTKLKNHINAISMKQFNLSPSKKPSNTYQSFKLNLDNVFDETRLEATASSEADNTKKNVKNFRYNEEEDIMFDRSQYDETKNGRGQIKNQLNVQDESTNMRSNQMIIEEDELNLRHQTRFQSFVNNNQTKFIVLFVVLMIIQLIISNIIFFRSTSFSHYKILTPFVHPLVIIFSLVFKDYSCNFMKNSNMN